MLELMWLVWLDGWTGEHWVSVVWTCATTSMPILIGIIQYMDWMDRRRMRARLKRWVG